MIPKRYHKRLAIFAIVAGMIMLVAGATSDRVYYAPGVFCTVVGSLYLLVNKETR